MTQEERRKLLIALDCNIASKCVELELISSRINLLESKEEDSISEFQSKRYLLSLSTYRTLYLEKLKSLKLLQQKRKQYE